jgi:NADH-quinone oxidoreductase subunit G
MATIYIDQHPYTADPSHNLLQVCLSLKLNLPYFCWHPALGSVGACRQCAVKQFRDEHDTRGRLVMACMTPAADNTRIAIDDPEARAFRASVIEWLMVNHPHDCPVCDEGGHCHLQDMTLMTGHTYRRYRFQKRTYRNQDLGPFINHEMNRCIQCYRCVRFYRDYAGGRDLNAFALRNQVYFGRHADGVLESEFSGNLVEVCPTGVFTDKTLKQHYTRKWDLQFAPSLCVHCGVGCNVFGAERYGTLRQISNRYNHEVNGYFLCDRGRFGYGFVNSSQRLRQPLLRHPGSATAAPVTPETALAHAAALLERGTPVLGIGSPRASLEANFALRTLVGAEHFYPGLSAREARLLAVMLNLMQDVARTPSVREVEQADAVLVLGEDVSNVAPRLALALRQSVLQQPLRRTDQLSIPRWHDAAIREVVQQQTGPLFLATPRHTRLDDIATQTYHAAPDDIARLGFTVAHLLSPDAPPVADLPEPVQALAKHVASALQEAERPLVIAGPSLGSEAILQAAANVARALCQHHRPAHLCFTAPECNSLGLALLGGGSLEAAFQAVRDGVAETVVVLENDLYRRAEAPTVRAFLEECRHVLVIDHLAHGTTAHAEVVLPASTFAESSGTLVSSEGRAQRFLPVYVPEGDIQDSWRWLRDLLTASGQDVESSWHNLDDVMHALEREMPVFAGIADITPPADFRLLGRPIPRQPHRYSGRTAMAAHRTVREPRPPPDMDTPLAFTMEGYRGQPPAPLIPFYWTPGWNSVQALNKYQSEVGGPYPDSTPGVRVLEPAREQSMAYFAGVPAAFAPRRDAWLLVPCYDIFGSEELSVLAPAVAERLPVPYLALHPDDAAALGVDADGEVIIQPGGSRYRLRVRLDTTLPRGVAGLPAGLPALQGLELPAWSALTTGETA